MALADSVPGVSGGTIAFILGFYDDFIGSLNSLISKNSKEDKKQAIFFLIKLGIGWITGMVLSVLILSSIFDSHIYSISSLFTGFIIVAIPLIIKQENDSLIGKYKNIIFTLIGALIVGLITYFNPAGTNGGMNLSLGSLNFGLGIFVFVAGLIAISAMVLPGISGSTLLLIFGLYIPIMTGIKETIHLNFSYLPALIIFGLGVICGIIFFVGLIKKSLNKHRSETVYAILGMMLGSLYAIVMGPTTLDKPLPCLSIHTFSIISFIIGAIVIFGLQGLKKLMESK